MISAKLLAYSQSSETGAKLATFALEYPRTIHAELMTHRVFARNASSSRAIPINKMTDAIEANPYEPWHITANQRGMQGFEEVSESSKETGLALIRHHREVSTKVAAGLAELGWHKQLFNRYTEAHQYIRVLVTSSTFRNFFLLRTDKMAEPHLQDLARAMVEELEHAAPRVLGRGQWHLPYWTEGDEIAMTKFIEDESSMLISLPEAHFIPSTGMRGLRQAIRIGVSAGRCARVSYYNFDGEELDIVASLKIYEKLCSSVPFHPSPIEHQATPDWIRNPWLEKTDWANPDKHGNLFGWQQARKFIPGEAGDIKDALHWW
jgi:hypothetical protein